MQGKPAASRLESASDESSTAAGNAVDMGLQTVGTLDLGGSSLEVTFMPTSSPLQHATGAIPDAQVSTLASQWSILFCTQHEKTRWKPHMALVLMILTLNWLG